MSRGLYWLARMATAWLAMLIAPGFAVRAQVVVRENFDGPDASWRDGRGNPSYRITMHERTSVGAHSGSGCEFFQFSSGNNGTYAHLLHNIAPARVIAELKPSLWVRADQQGIQLRARVVFPRSINPQTTQADSALIAGTSYSRVGNWEQLRFDDVPKLVAAQARVLRAETKRDIDAHEAYVDQLVLNLLTPAGLTQIWIDDLEVAGFVGQSNPQDGGPSSPELVSPRASPRGQLTSQGGSATATPAAQRVGPQFSGSVLMLNDRPFFPRAIEYQGEPLEYLKQRGFNTVRLRSLPSTEMLNEATRAGMWLICAPPMPTGLGKAAPDAEPLAAITPEFDCVLAWDLGEGLTGREKEAVRSWAEHVRRADPHARPILCGPSAELRAYSAPGRADVLLLDRYTPFTSFELTDYRRWLRDRPLFARHGTPIWSTVPTEPAPALVSQLAGLSAGQPVSLLAGTEQTRLITYTALGSGVRGLIFASHGPLNAEDADTRWRAAQLELLNLELGLLEPWIAGGTIVTTVTSTDAEIQAAVLQVGGAHMVLPVWSGKGAQFVPGQSNVVGELSFAVPETINAHEIWPGGIRPLRKRVTGGVSVTVDDFGISSMIILTQDLMGEITRRAMLSGDRALTLALELARAKLDIDTAVRSRLDGKAKALGRGDELLKMARSELQAAEMAMSAGNSSEAFRHAQFCQRNLRAMERSFWLSAIAKLGSPTNSPFGVSFTTLPQHFSLMANVNGARRTANLLPEGNFEDQARAVHSGWKHFQHPPEGVHEQATLAAEKHVEGKMSLHMSVTAIDVEAPPEQFETPPGWITSPAMPVEPGTLLRLHGRVLVPTPIKGTPDGLLILDSLGGEALAERVLHAPQWREFTAYRIADDSRTFTVTFAMTGLGEAWIDDVTVEPVTPRAPARGPCHLIQRP